MAARSEIPAPIQQKHPFRGLLAAAVATLVLLLFFSPPWHVFLRWTQLPECWTFPELRRAATLLGQAENPFAPIADSVHRSLQWRLLFPLLAHYLHLPAAVLLACPFVGALLALRTIFVLARRRGAGFVHAWCGTLVLGATGWFFTTTGWLGYFDSWLLLGLLAASHGRSRLALWLACLLTPWVDERFVIGFPVALAVRALQPDGVSADGRAGWRRVFDRTTLIALGIVAGFIVVRIALAGQRDSLKITEYLGAQQTFHIGLARHALGLWESLRFAWVFAGIGLFSLARSATPANRTVLLALVASTMLVSNLIANDLSRAAIVLMPLAVEGVIRLPQLPNPWPRLIVPLMLCALIAPARLVITDFSVSIPRCSSVVAAWRQPTAKLVAARWVQAATESIKGGRLAEAAQRIDLALQLDEQSAGAHNAGGVLAFQTGQWELALANFTTACRLDATDATFRINRAVAAGRSGQLATCREALAEARRLARDDPGLLRQISDLERSANLSR